MAVSKTSSHIIASSQAKGKCATKSQPWIIEAPLGQKIKITVIDFLASRISQNKEKTNSCLGVVIDKAAKRNVSICCGGEQRTRYLYSSKAESVEISYNMETKEESNDDVAQFALQFEGTFNLVKYKLEGLFYS